MLEVAQAMRLKGLSVLLGMLKIPLVLQLEIKLEMLFFLFLDYILLLESCVCTSGTRSFDHVELLRTRVKENTITYPILACSNTYV